MKNIFIAIFALICSFNTAGALAEEPQAVADAQAAHYFDQFRAEFRRNKAALVGLQMDLSASELEIFWKVYAEYERELVTLNNKRIKTLESYLESHDKMNAKSASSLLTQYFANQRSRTTLIEKYAGKLSRLLSPLVALRFVHVEAQINLVIDTELASQLPLARGEEAPTE